MPRVARAGFGITPGQRLATGCIVTFHEGTVRHFTGEGKNATRAAAEYADAHGLRVRTISTPQTVYRDLHGNRERLDTDHDKTYRSTAPHLPEAKMLSAIGRMDLLS